jgi:hypothetical protein
LKNLLAKAIGKNCILCFAQKHQDAFASAFGFFLFGYDYVSQYLGPYPSKFFRISDPVLWFFKVIINSVQWEGLPRHNRRHFVRPITRICS